MTPSGPLGRDAMAFREKMVKYHGEIARLMDAAYINCEENGQDNDCKGCPFEDDIYCAVEEIRGALRIGKHDCMVPPCQCAGDCGKGKVRE